jgi:hypothetical protein
MPSRSASDDASGLAPIGDADDRDAGATTTAHAGTQRLGTGEIQDDDDVGVWLLRRGWRDLGRLFERLTVWPRRSSISARPSRSGVGGDQEDRRGHAHFTCTCFGVAADASGSISISVTSRRYTSPPIGPAVVVLVEGRRLQRPPS